VTNVQVKTRRIARPSQGDIFRNIECIEYVIEKRGVVEVSKLVFPLVVVLTQDCDLEQNARYRSRTPPSNDDKKLFAVLVAPLYNAEQVFLGQHLSELQMQMAPINEKRTPGEYLKKNERPRYHYLDFPEEVPIVPSVVDFKHYFSVSILYLEKLRATSFVCRLSELFREDLSQRFAGYLARIGLPEVSPVPSAPTPAKAASVPAPAPEPKLASS
jgi:hypothetical protein